MINASSHDFKSVIHSLKMRMMGAPPVRTERWQGVVANTDTFELQNVVFEVDLQGTEDLDHWRADIGPNLPWADDHFLERAGGVCLNPGVQWKNWPWGQSANNFRGPEEFGPRMAPHDWAYLAGIVDGDGTIYYQKHKIPNFQGSVRVYQKDAAVLNHIKNLFKVGSVNAAQAQDRTTTVPNGTVYQNNMNIWQVWTAHDCRWILTGLLPYLVVKKDKAIEMLDAIKVCLSDQKKSGAPLKTVWNKPWPARFNHSYSDRLWPKHLEGGSEFRGQNWSYGDLGDLVQLIAKEPHTRQGWIPLFFPEDTGFGDGGRKPCTLGYQLMVREDRLHMYYPLRSCDLRRHFPDDIYLAVRLLLWVLDRCREIRPEFWKGVKPGRYAMHCTSLHIFATDKKEFLG